MRITPSYTKVETCIWNDPRVRKLKKARGLFGWLMTCPLMSKVPGLIIHGIGALTDEWQISEERFREEFAELEAADPPLAVADWDARLVYVTPLLTEMVANRPTGPSQAAAFGTVIFKMAPDCVLRRRVDHDLRTLLCTSPPLMESYLRCRPLSTEDALRESGRPLPEQPRTGDPLLHLGQQLGLNYESSGAEEGAENTSSQASGSQPSPVLEVLTGGAAEAELVEGLDLLVMHAGAALGVLSAGVRAQIQFAWPTAFAAGWRKADLADLGEWIAAGNMGWLSKTSPAGYLATHLGDSLASMAKHRKARRVAPPPMASQGGTQQASRLHWSWDRDKRLTGCWSGQASVVVTMGDAWELRTIEQLYQRYQAGEDLDIEVIRKALAQKPRAAATVASHASTREIEELLALERVAAQSLTQYQGGEDGRETTAPDSQRGAAGIRG